MKRSEKFFRESAFFSLAAAMWAVFFLALAVWGYAAWLNHSAFAYFTWLLALVTAFLAITSAGESRRLYLLSKEHEAIEHRNMIRPRI